MKINIKGYISSVNDKDIILRVDKEEEDRINNALIHAKKDKQVSSNIIIKIQNAKFSIDTIKWNTLNDLIGVEVKCGCFLQKYKFVSNDKLIEGYSFRCTNINNCV